MSFKLAFSEDICDARLNRAYTQQFVADVARLSLREYQNVEAGRAIPKTESFLFLVYLFDLNINNYREVLGFANPLPSR